MIAPLHWRTAHPVSWQIGIMRAGLDTGSVLCAHEAAWQPPAHPVSRNTTAAVRLTARPSVLPHDQLTGPLVACDGCSLAGSP
jgi:hypothetical protein